MTALYGGVLKAGVKRLTSPSAKVAWPPDYVLEYVKRQERILALRSSPEALRGAKEYYRKPEHCAEWIEHFAVTYDPRNAGSNIPTKMPFVLFPKQREMVRFLLECLSGETNGLIEKSRDMGATWICGAVSVWLWLFWPGAAIGWGSKDQDLVDKIGDPDSILEKIRILIRFLPREFWPVGFTEKHMTFMRIVNPETGSTITGDCGDNIGRGGRKLIYFKDESAHYMHPEMIEAALGDNTRVQIDISSVNGPGNVFHRKREKGLEWASGRAVVKGRTNVFVMDWSDHPAKTLEWYETRRVEMEDAGLAHVFAQEVDRNYVASLDGVVIPSKWVRAAIDAHVKLGFDDSGGWCAGLDVADEGLDTNAIALRKGVILKHVEEWSERDTGKTTRRAVGVCEGLGPMDLEYDCIGVGSGVKAEANRLVDEGLMPKNLRFVPWNAGRSGVALEDPEGRVVPNDRNSPMNKDFFANLKAQAWWSLRRRFEATYRAVNEPGFTWEADDLISIPGDLPLLQKIIKELSQPTMGKSATLKTMINKKPDGTKSPNVADAIVECFFPVDCRAPIKISADFQRNLQRYGQRSR